MRYGYIRVSSEEQNLARQIDDMEKVGIPKENVYSEKKSGKDMDRVALQDLIKVVRSGDSITVTDITRLGRNMRDIVNLVDDLDKRCVTIISLKEGVDTSTQIGKVLITVLGAFSQMEREAIKERQRQGLMIAKREGRLLGRPKKPTDNFEHVYQQYLNNQISMEQALKLLECSRATFYRRALQYNDSQIIPF